jgi:hypothetical protein
MKFTAIFNETIGLFPENIALEGGKLIGEEGGHFPALSTAWDFAEKKAEELSDWHSLMVWAIYGDLHDQAKRKMKENKVFLSTSDINKSNVEKIFTESLFSPEVDYGNMKNEYENDLEP